MEEAKRIYTLLSQSNGLKIREISQALELDAYFVAEIMFSEECASFWYQNDDSLWFAIEGAIELDEPKVEKDELTTSVEIPQKFNTDKFPQKNISQTLRTYLSQIPFFRIYSNYELLELLRRYRNGDGKAYESLVKSQQRFVANIALLYNRKGVSLEDIIQEGNIGLVRAIERFDDSQSSSFNNYAKSWILQSISFAMVNLPYPIRLPINQISLYWKFRRFSDKYELQYGIPPSVDEIELEKEVDYKRLVFLSQLPDALNELVCSVDDLDCYESDDPSPDAELMRESWDYYLESLLSMCSDRNADIVRMYYGLPPYKMEYTLEEIGNSYNITRERARQIKEKTIRILREMAKYPISYLINHKCNYDVIQRSGEHRQKTSDFARKKLVPIKKSSSSGSRSIISYKELINLMSSAEHKENKIKNRVLFAAKNYIVKNVGNRCFIFRDGEEIFYSFGTILKIDNVLYRFAVLGIFYVNLIEVGENGKVVAGLKIIEAQPWTQLYKELSFASFEEKIQDIRRDAHTDHYIIKVKGIWYDHLGGRTECIPEESIIIKSHTFNNNLNNTSTLEHQYLPVYVEDESFDYKNGKVELGQILKIRSSQEIGKVLNIYKLSETKRQLLLEMKKDDSIRKIEDDNTLFVVMRKTCSVKNNSVSIEDYRDAKRSTVEFSKYNKKVQEKENVKPQLVKKNTEFQNSGGEVESPNQMHQTDNNQVIDFVPLSKIKVINGCMYRLSYSSSAFFVNIIKHISKDKYRIGRLVIFSSYQSPLYKVLDANNYMQQIESIHQLQSEDKCIIKVLGVWYNNTGHLR